MKYTAKQLITSFFLILLLCTTVTPLAGATNNASDSSAPAMQETAAPAATPAEAPAAVKQEKKKYTLEEAIAATPKGAAAGEINPAEAPGFLNIPGAPQVNLFMAFAWALWVGWIFSTVGAFGGVMAGVGHMSVFGLGSYASSFGKGSPMNSLVTDSIRVSNQFLVGFSSLVSSIKYASLGRIVLPLGIALGIGSLAGSYLIPTLTQGKLSFKGYQGYFGIFVLVLGLYLLYETSPFGQAKKKKGAEAAKAFEEASKKTGTDCTIQTGVKVKSISLSRVTFTFCGVEFSFNTLLPIIGGFFIASAASFLGVGGGFLLVPFLTSISQLPMYLAAGTSAFAVLIGMITSISTFMLGGTNVDWHLVGIELVGIALGSWIGPMTAKFIPDKWLKRLFILVALYVGLDYTLKGFFHISIW